jgi:hypothetical protein
VSPGVQWTAGHCPANDWLASTVGVLHPGKHPADDHDESNYYEYCPNQAAHHVPFDVAVGGL